MNRQEWRKFLHEYWDALTAAYGDPVVYDAVRDEYLLRFYQRLAIGRHGQPQ